MALINPEMVEPKTFGRQLFSLADVGIQSEAQMEIDLSTGQFPSIPRRNAGEPLGETCKMRDD